MVCCQVFGNHTTITVAGSQGHFELKRLQSRWLAYCMMHSIQLMSERHPVVHPTLHRGKSRADEKRIRDLMERSLMLVTALAPQNRL